MLSCDVFEAFKAAGADDEKARKAAEALAHADGQLGERFERFGKLDERFLRADERFIRIEGKLDLHSWMIGAVVALNIAILVRPLVPG